MDLQAVIFDYGEVLSGPPDPQAHRNLLAIAGVKEEAFEKSYWAHRLDYDADILNGQTYWQTVARDTGAKFTAEADRAAPGAGCPDVDGSQPSDARLDPQDQAGRLPSRHPVKHGIRRAWLYASALLLAVQFDHLTWSCELGVVKPDPAIYLHTVKKLGVAPDQALFIDNLEKNIVGAEAVGLHAALFQNVEQLQTDLARRGFPLPVLEPVA